MLLRLQSDSSAFNWLNFFRFFYSFFVLFFRMQYHIFSFVILLCAYDLVSNILNFSWNFFFLILHHPIFIKLLKIYYSCSFFTRNVDSKVKFKICRLSIDHSYITFVILISPLKNRPLCRKVFCLCSFFLQ